MRAILRHLALFLLSLALRVPFVIGLVCGIIAAGVVLCVAAFQNGFYRVYGEQ
jgi:hypothetical protein